MRGKDVNCSIVFKYGMKRDFNAWLATLGAGAPVKTLTQLREWNLAHRAEGAIKYGQIQLDNSDCRGSRGPIARAIWPDRQKDMRVTGTDGIDAVFKRERLDALLFVGSSGSAFAAKPGYPTVIVPFAFVPNAPTPPFPPGFDAKPSPHRHQLYGYRVQRAALDRAGLCVRAGDEAKSRAGGVSLESSQRQGARDAKESYKRILGVFASLR
jgi:hypothetical protein